jgi:hypothetical protein
MAVILAVVFVAAWRRTPDVPQGPARTFFDFFSRRVVLAATGVGMIACAAFAAFWVWLILLDRS